MDDEIVEEPIEVDDLTPETPVDRTAICGTEGCVNYALPVTMRMVSTVYCGGCGTLIEDVSEV